MNLHYNVVDQPNKVTTLKRARLSQVLYQQGVLLGKRAVGVIQDAARMAGVCRDSLLLAKAMIEHVWIVGYV